MTLNVDIASKASLIRANSRTYSFQEEISSSPVIHYISSTARKIIRFIEFDFLKNKFYNSIDEFSVLNEGLLSHISSMQLNDINKMYKDIAYIIDTLDALDESLDSKNYFNDKVLRSKFKYMLKTNYKLEASLRSQLFKNVLCEKTPDDLKEQFVLYTHKNLMNSLKSENAISEG